MRPLYVSAFAAIVLASPVLADQAQVKRVTARQAGGGWTFDVTVSHPDTGWDHYADGWSVSTPDGTELGFRKLAHPHETEQPFTRSLSGVTVPSGVNEVIIRARDNVHGWSDQAYTVKLK
ncbi:hypothetical protein BDE40_2985 [Litoreibacter halocynthiae]|uniref:Secreted protein n=1 Tax=Litoreibacter halocynthiae TaxID=1242689 RepID=A0A4R7LEW9_9RHOB|nr:hypothetical protein [Litoreibacter halocynthiae]TDT74197.1 hypothetical protein BDE40_2985 [Litoreibacter halocynthiae]